MGAEGDGVEFAHPRRPAFSGRARVFQSTRQHPHTPCMPQPHGPTHWSTGETTKGRLRTAVVSSSSSSPLLRRISRRDITGCFCADNFIPEARSSTGIFGVVGRASMMSPRREIKVLKTAARDQGAKKMLDFDLEKPSRFGGHEVL